ncbi:uncharacterized protein L203_102668 [Cryptococcus depauperatus CBS 7841]|uniref:Uncharacterized protein n=1 Tax=Cryptococcus depauperatus CBS 7841 TaxID=1295531 RepID=A0A1E3IFU6_9TREE|nr:hypothetical protein L203_04036 [Cryptococcus depauperatus CBS 7841]
MSLLSMDPLLIAHPPTTFAPLDADDAEVPFESYCIVCDKRIVQAEGEARPAKEGKEKLKRRMAGGTIRVKNPDGTTTTRNANGKVTRPPLKRNPNTATRTATTGGIKAQPVVRAKTVDGCGASELQMVKKDSLGQSPSSAFVSSIYCSKECMEAEAGRSNEAYKNISRAMSFDFANTFHSPYDVLPATDTGKSPVIPPSPLLVSDNDTESSSSAGQQVDHNTSSSAPKIMDYFRFTKEDPDAAWHEVERQRRCSMQTASQRLMQSTDSLTSLWQPEAEMGRSFSGGGKMRSMTPFYSPDGEWKASDGRVSGMPIPVRGGPRSNLSHTSLAGSASFRQSHFPPEFGSAPSHTLGLLQSYASAFSHRSSCNTPSSFSQRGIISPDGGATLTVAPTNKRRGSGSSIARPLSGTIKARKPEPTWDSFGKEAVQAKNERAHRRSNESRTDATPVAMTRRRDRSVESVDGTPRQNLQRDGQSWKVKYIVPAGVERNSTIQSKRPLVASSLSTGYPPRGIVAPHPQPLLSTSIPLGSHTPTSRMLSRAATTAIPEMAGLQLEDKVVPAQSAQSVPRRIGFSWETTQGMMTYEIPGKLDKNQKGLFYFQ